MKLYVVNDSRPQHGGGFSFTSAFVKHMKDYLVDNIEEASHLLLPGSTMVKPERLEQLKQLKQMGKKIVLRVDNVLKHSRNNGRGMSRMRNYADIADLVIFQCKWSRDYLCEPLGNPNHTVIYNGVDMDIFKPDGPRIDFGSKPVYLYAAASKGEHKRWEWAWWHYQQVYRKNPNAMLLIAGKVSTPVMQNNFDFFNNERYTYLGMVSSPEEMAQVYRSADYYYAVFENDCYSNGILEALACGLSLAETSMTGGTPELLENWDKGREYNSLNRTCKEYKEALERL